MALILPEDGIIETLTLNPLSTLSMSNLIKLTEVQLDEGIYSTMNNLTVKNCPAMDEYTHRMVLEAPMTNYALTDFTWTIEDNNGLTLENGKAIGLAAVDKLKTKLANGGTPAAALIGTINVDVDCTIDEFEIYKKYCKTYPNLIINYTDKVSGLNPAVKLEFMTGNEDTAILHYRVLGSGDASGDTVAKLISAEGPLGQAMTIPIRQSTTDKVFIFTGYWIDQNGNRYYQSDIVTEPQEGAINFDTFVPTTSLVFHPEFIDRVRGYEVKFMDFDGNIILQNGMEYYEVPYGSTYKAAGGPMTNFYYKDSSSLRDDQRYGFQGWSTNKYGIEEIKNPSYINLNTHVVTGPITLFPHYLVEDVHKVPSSMEYFTISGNTITLKDQYKSTLEGKVTVPKATGVTTIGGFGSDRITHIYFENGNSINTIANNAFMGSAALKLIEIPAAVTSIGNYAFQSCKELVTADLPNSITSIGSYAFNGDSKLSITALPESLESLGARAFYSCEQIQISSLPVGLQILGESTFRQCYNVKISEFGSDSSTGSQLRIIGDGCFYRAGIGSHGADVTEIMIRNTVTSIGENAFNGYASNTLKTVYFAKPYDTSYGHTPGEMGFVGVDFGTIG